MVKYKIKQKTCENYFCCNQSLFSDKWRKRFGGTALTLNLSCILFEEPLHNSVTSRHFTCLKRESVPRPSSTLSEPLPSATVAKNCRCTVTSLNNLNQLLSCSSGKNPFSVGLKYIYTYIYMYIQQVCTGICVYDVCCAYMYICTKIYGHILYILLYIYMPYMYVARHICRGPI